MHGSSPSTHQLLSACLRSLEQGLLERETPARLLLLSALAGEHALLIGPPGTAKSELARRLHRCFEHARYFERLLTRFSTPEELFGPLSLKALEDDRYERLVDGFLPTASIAFLDEVFKANSAILNTLLTLLNEREFDNGSGRAKVPLISVIAASNEVPVDEALQAFHDRFLIRIPVAPISDHQFETLLQLPAQAAAPPPDVLSRADAQAWRDAARQVTLSPAALQACGALRSWLAQQQIHLSDRRWRKWMELLRVAAATEGRSTVDALDLWLAPHVASPNPEVAPRIAAWFAHACLQAVAQDAPWLTRAVEAFEQQLQIETTAESEEPDGGAGKLALARAISGSAQAEEHMPRILAASLEEQARRRWSTAHIDARTGQVQELLARAGAERAHIQQRRDHLLADATGRLWLPPALLQQWLGAHDHSLKILEELLDRLRQVQQGFAHLPLDKTVSTAAPQPVRWPEPQPGEAAWPLGC